MIVDATPREAFIGVEQSNLTFRQYASRGPALTTSTEQMLEESTAYRVYGLMLKAAFNPSCENSQCERTPHRPLRTSRGHTQ